MNIYQDIQCLKIAQICLYVYTQIHIYTFYLCKQVHDINKSYIKHTTYSYTLYIEKFKYTSPVPMYTMYTVSVYICSNFHKAI